MSVVAIDPRVTGIITKDLVKPIKKGGKRQSCRSNRIVFTLNNFTPEESLQLNQSLTSLMSSRRLVYAIIGQEVGQSGTPHLQGFIHLAPSFMKVVSGTVSTWKSTIPSLARAHLESAYGSDLESQKYCSKDGTYVEYGEPDTDQRDVWTKIIEATSLREIGELDAMFLAKSYSQAKALVRDNKRRKRIPVSVPSLRLWQSQLLWRLMNQSNRQILFVVDRIGNRGKSTFCQYLRATYGEEVFYTAGGKSEDIAHALAEQDLACFDSCVKYMCIDLPRQVLPQFAPWSIIEAVKNGMFFTGKYGSATHILDKPLKLVVFTNHDLDDCRGKLSADRWSVIDLDDEYRLKGPALDVLIEQEDPVLQLPDSAPIQEDTMTDEELLALIESC